MTSTDTLPTPGTAEGRAALEQEARGHGFPDTRAYTEAYAAGRIDTRGVGDRPGDPRTGFGQVQAYAKAAAIWGILLVEYAALSPAETPAAAAAPVDDAPPPEAPDEGDDDVRPEPPRLRSTDEPDRDPEPVAPRADTTFQSVAATVAVVDMADGEAFDGVHSLDLVTPPGQSGHAAPDPVEHTEADAGPETATKDLAFGSVTPDDPITDAPVFGAGFPLVAGELGVPDDPGVRAVFVETPPDTAEAFGTGTGDLPGAPDADAIPHVGDALVADEDAGDGGTDPMDEGDADGPGDADDYADLGDHVPALDAQEAHDDPGDHTAVDGDHHAVEPDPAPDTAGSGGESFT